MGTYQFYSSRTQSGTLQELESVNFKKTTDDYLEKFNKCFNLKIFSLDQAVDILHDKMLTLQKQLPSALTIALEYNKIPKKYQKYQESLLIIKLQVLQSKLDNLNVA